MFSLKHVNFPKKQAARVVRITCLITTVFLFMMVGCAAGPNPLANTPDVGGNVAGFWIGLWHGLIVPLTFICSLLTSSVQFYDVYNNGWPYNLGFLLGASVTLGGSGSAAKVSYSHGEPD